MKKFFVAGARGGSAIIRMLKQHGYGQEINNENTKPSRKELNLPNFSDVNKV